MTGCYDRYKRNLFNKYDLKSFVSPWVRIKVSKPGAVARAANVGVIIERGLNLKQNFSYTRIRLPFW
jgi:hypothetical protein